MATLNQAVDNILNDRAVHRSIPVNFHSRAICKKIDEPLSIHIVTLSKW